MQITTKLNPGDCCYGLLKNKVEIFNITDVKVTITGQPPLFTIEIDYCIESQTTEYNRIYKNQQPIYSGSIPESRLFATKEELLASL